ncbi:hypothetical protein ACWDBD_36750 [Streptomyces sp. NPDC001118]
MKSIDGRQWANREDLIEHSGYSRATLANLWSDREANGHPPAHKVDGVMHWDLEVWSEWFAEHRQQQARQESKVDRSGDPDEELPPAGQARVLGVDTSRISQYEKNPPPGWPEGRVEQLPTRIRRWRTRRQLWEFADRNPGFGTVGGRPSGPDPKAREAKAQAPDPRVRQAAEVLAAEPGRKAGEVAADLAARHGGSVHTWKRIVTEARKQADQQEG